MNSSKSKPLWMVAAVAATAIMYSFGASIDPIPWLPLLVWVAPLPMLLVAPRLRTRTAFLVALVAWLLGALRLYAYFLNAIELPLVLIAVLALLMSTSFAGCVLLFRALVLRGRFWLAAVATPAAWVCVEYGVSLAIAETAGNWWSMAYTQADFLPVLQTASVAGTAGVSFLLFALSAAVAAIAAPGATVPARALTGGTVAVLLAAALGYGFTRPGQGGDTVNAAALGYRPTEISIPVDDAEAKELTGRYRAQIERLAQDGVSVVVLPEKVFRIDKGQKESAFDEWGSIARDANVDVVLGIELEERDIVSNAAVWFPAKGGDVTVYRKNHLIPWLERELTASDDTTFAPGHDDWGIAICKDFDYTSLTARYGDAGATVMYAPALDFDVDGWWHSRIAITRGVEQGMSLVRTGLQGRMTVSDPYGRVLAEGGTQAVSEVSTEGASTLYSRFGDWLVWVCAGLTALGLLFAVRRRPIVT